MSEGFIRRVIYRTLPALHHLYTAYGERLVIGLRALSPEKRELLWVLNT